MSETKSPASAALGVDAPRHEPAYVLAFDTANEVIAVGVGVLHEEAHAIELVAHAEIEARRQSNTQLIPRIDALLAENGIARGDIACVCVGRGPGSFTGVRIAMATAKGIASALEVGLVGVSSLDAVAWGVWEFGARGEVAVVADAMRKEVYPVRYLVDDAGAHRLEADRVVKADLAAEELAECDAVTSGASDAGAPEAGRHTPCSSSPRCAAELRARPLPAAFRVEGGVQPTRLEVATRLKQWTGILSRITRIVAQGGSMKAGDKYQACVDALAAYAKGIGFSQVVIGLSGGIDSSVTAVMAVDAFGAKNVHGVLLPGPYSTGHSIDDALTLAENLGIESHTVSICEPFEAFEQVIRKSYKEKLEGLASENTQARCRMVILMALSNANRWMLVNTGNKSEAAMGYSTLYGDTAGAFAPLGGLYKTDVYEVGRWRNEQARAAGVVEPIPENVFVKPPSAELAPGQKDEASMGIDYETLDKLLIAVQEQGQSVEDACDALGFDIMQATGLLARVDSYAFKRAQEPPFPDVKFYG